MPNIFDEEVFRQTHPYCDLKVCFQEEENTVIAQIVCHHRERVRVRERERESEREREREREI